MDKRTLHIFNGDSSYELFKLNGEVPGECLVWRELLCDGKSVYEIGSQEFWDTRTKFFEEELQIDSDDYASKTIAEFERIEIHAFHEIVLWFEYDLFCQINCLAIISYLYQQTFEGEISVLNILSFQEEPYTGLGELSADFYKQIYDNRKRLDGDTVELADIFWFEFCSSDHSGLLGLASILKFPYLEETTKILLDRRKKKSGITYYERLILESISEKGTNTKMMYSTIFSQIRKEGFGDVQITKALKALASYYDRKEDEFYLNKKGKDLLAGAIEHGDYIYPSYLGGTPH